MLIAFIFNTRTIYIIQKIYFLEKRFAESESVLDAKGEMTLKWRVDYEDKKIQFRVDFSDKAPHINWFALGFSDRGNMENSDVCLVWTDYKGKDHFEVKQI